ncbi:MAG: NAD(P)H-dependent oxidoreductase subunit E [Chloroflexi bacterium]|nr:NAD(P)H-dependent oxidoreductase subunit E [Chloroflexota bacterium]
MTQERAGLRQQAREILESHRKSQSTVTVLSCLLALEDHLGWLPEEAIDEAARFNNVSTNDVWAVASFYTNFRLSPPPAHTIEVCWGPTCHIKGAMAVLAHIQDALHLNSEGDTADGGVTLKYNTCLGACAQAPVVMADHHLMGPASPQEAAELVRRLVGLAGD